MTEPLYAPAPRALIVGVEDVRGIPGDVGGGDVAFNVTAVAS